MNFVITSDGTVRSYKSARVAQAMCSQLFAAGDTSAVVATSESVASVPTSLLVTLHNIIRPEKPVKKFADRETAEKRMKGVLDVLGKPGEQPTLSVAADPADDTTTTEEGQVATKSKRASKKVKTESPNGAGRRTKYAGKVIRKIATKNPRREGTGGHASWGVLKDGMAVEAYLAAGGRTQDLEWDIAHDWAKLENA